jgi:signal transduction histidine kinase
MTQNLLQCEDLTASSGDAASPSRNVTNALPQGLHTDKTFEEVLFNMVDGVMLSRQMQFRILVAGRPKVLSSYIEEQICIIAREALVNALRHANATSVEAEIEYLPSKFRVVVRDNGRGMGSQAVGRNSHGLVEMRERAGKIGGELRVWSRRGAGTEVEVCVPRVTSETCRPTPPEVASAA